MTLLINMLLQLLKHGTLGSLAVKLL
ncbi:hypothetical protein WG8_4077 [Paenibacillus sp. Aloe-11]|nr:hypothetical protein WG8_4077 [Paenibacillus sp. Aloe-11]